MRKFLYVKDTCLKESDITIFGHGLFSFIYKVGYIIFNKI